MTGQKRNSRDFGLFSPASGGLNPLISKPELPHGAVQATTTTETVLSKKLALISEREGEDAVLTGGTRSLHRRLLALNIYETTSGVQAQPTHLTLPPRALSA